jgi:hypothetical protein
MAAERMAASRRRMTWKSALLLVVAGSLAVPIAAEFVFRLGTHTLFVWGYWDVEDPEVGRIPHRPGFYIRDPIRGVEYSTLEHSIRSNGHAAVYAERPLTLAVGDSFTFGEDVSNDESWPAYLEEFMGHRVINGGVPGFGFDQTVLRAEQLSNIYHPDTIVLSFIAVDISRAEYSYGKPYFDISSPPRSSSFIRWFLPLG